MFQIGYDDAKGIVFTKVEGFWTLADVKACATDMRPYLTAAKNAAGPVLVLCDARKFPVQSPEVASAFRQMELEMGAMRDRMAIVVSSTLVKMQGQRSLDASPIEYFSSIEQAEAWLLGAE